VLSSLKCAALCLGAFTRSALLDLRTDQRLVARGQTVCCGVPSARRCSRSRPPLRRWIQAPRSSHSRSSRTPCRRPGTSILATPKTSDRGWDPPSSSPRGCRHVKKPETVSNGGACMRLWHRGRATQLLTTGRQSTYLRRPPTLRRRLCDVRRVSQVTIRPQESSSGFKSCSAAAPARCPALTGPPVVCSRTKLEYRAVPMRKGRCHLPWTTAGW
jgi:hypothetical protein